MKKKAIICAKHLSKTFPSSTNHASTNHALLNKISLTIYPGETVAIMGPSGVGKTTLLHILGTLDSPDSGTLEIVGKSTQGPLLSTIRNQHIGFIFQNCNLLEEYSVIENVLMPARIGRKPLSFSHGKALLEQVNLLNHTNQLVKELSGGEKQRVAIARALCNHPDLLLADEPSGNLDDANSAVIHQLLIHLAKDLEKALLIVTHNQGLANLCDQIYTLQEGHLTPTPPCPCP